MAETPSTNEADDKGAELLRLGNKWLERIRAAEKREEDWMKDAEAAEKAYSCDHNSKGEGKLYDFNILHSNVETIVPAIFNSTPVADVRSRNTLPEVQMPDPPQPQQGQQPDPRAVQQFQAQAQAAQEAQAQAKAVKDFGTMIERAITVQIDDNKLDTEVESAAQDSFLSGRGIVRVRLHVDDDGGNERLSYEAVSWRDYRRGPAKRWEDRPWEAYRHSMPREELERFGDPELIQTQTDPAKAIKADDDEDDIVVWEIWCKEPDRYVKFVRESDGMIIKKEPDPLGLTGFFPIANPVQPISLTGKLMPVCPFTVYKKLADELDLCTKRINAIMKGLKVRGGIAGDAADIEALAQADDNQLIVLKGLEGLAQTKGLEGAIMWWPVEKAIVVLKELYVQREQIKQSIYELTGISDIVRGASNAGETATAQQIKTQWGSLRIQKMQRLIQRLVRDLFIISAEIITTKFSPQTLQVMTGIEITPMIQTLMQQKILAYYRVDVESDSTVKADTSRIKGEMSEFMGGTGQYFSVMAPLVQTDPAMAKPVAQIYAAFARNWNLGKQAEDALEDLTNMAEQAGKKPKPNPEAEKLKGEMQLKQAQMQMDGQKMQAEMQMKRDALQAEMASKERETQLKMAENAGDVQTKREIAQIDLEIKQIDLLIKREELAMKQQSAQIDLASKSETNAIKLDGQRQANELKAQQARQKKPAPAE